jgi:hypothetical protein
MKKLLIVAMLLATTTAYAADTSSTAADAPASHRSHAPQDFGKAKAQRLQHISDHIVLLQKAQSCVQAASDFDAMKACNLRKSHGGGHHRAKQGDAQPDTTDSGK